MKKLIPYMIAAGSVLNAESAVSFTLNIDDGSDIGGTGGNPANSGVFVARNPGQTDPSTGIYSEATANTSENNPTYTTTYTARFDDDTLGLGLTGLTIQYEITASAFIFNGTETVSANVDEASGLLGIRGGTNSSTIDSPEGFGSGEFEFMRLAIGNVTILADPGNVLGGRAVSIDGFVGQTIRVGSSDGAETGSVYIGGNSNVGNISLADFDGTSFRQYLTWATPQLEVDTFPDTAPTSGNQGIDVQGFRAQFTIAPIIPEPSNLIFLGMATLGLVTRRLR